MISSSRNRVLRIQDADGRGPYKPGFSGVWCDNFGAPPPPTWMQEFPGLLRRMNENAHYGAACRSVEQIRKWFTPTELLRLHLLGYRLVAMEADRILAESKNQIVFMRRKPLNVDIEFIASESIHSGSAPPIHDVHGFTDEHAANAPSPGHGTVRDQRTPRAAIDGLSSKPATIPTCAASAERRHLRGLSDRAALSSAELERSIDAAALWLSTAQTVEQRRSAWNVLQTLVRMRSDARVREMEKERGIDG